MMNLCIHFIMNLTKYKNLNCKLNFNTGNISYLKCILLNHKYNYYISHIYIYNYVCIYIYLYIFYIYIKYLTYNILPTLLIMRVFILYVVRKICSVVIFKYLDFCI